MATVLVTSAAGAPGVTATAVGLALIWPSPVLLADCDRTPSQAVLAGYLRGTDAGGLGLTGLARAHREGRPLSQAVAGETIPLALGGVRRDFLPGFATPGAAALFDPAWSGLSALRLHLPVLRESVERLRGSSDGVGLVLVGEGQPYTADEIRAQFGVRIWGALPDDPGGAAVLAQGAPEPRRYGDSRYLRAVRTLSSVVVAHLHHQRLRIAGAA